jgi:hypothetical protein
MTDRLLGTLISSTAEELGDLVLQRLLRDQPRSQAANCLDPVVLAGHTGQRVIQFRAKPLARGYLLHAGVPPSLRLLGQSGGYARDYKFPRALGIC